MNSITQVAQLSTEELKAIVSGKPDAVKDMIEGLYDPEELRCLAEGFAKKAYAKMGQAFQIFVEGIIGEEFMAMLEDAEKEGKDTSRNGYYQRQIRSCMGDFTIQIPRARYLAFRTGLLEKYGHSIDNLSDKVIDLYGGGMTLNDITDRLMSMYGVKLSRESVAKIVRETLRDALAFNTEKIPDCPVVYMDATYVPFKHAINGSKSVENQGILVALGITPQGKRRVLGFAFGETESIDRWKMLLRDLRSRGLKNPRLFVTDGLSGMPEAVKEYFPKALHQRCLVHYMRNLKGYVSRKEAKDIIADFKAVVDAPDRNTAKKRFQQFTAVWGNSHIGLRNMLEKTDNNIFAYYDFPPAIWKSIRTSNAIEGFNSKLKRDSRKRILMNSEENATIVYTEICRSYNSTKLGRVLNGLNRMTNEEKLSMGFEVED